MPNAVSRSQCVRISSLLSRSQCVAQPRKPVETGTSHVVTMTGPTRDTKVVNPTRTALPHEGRKRGKNTSHTKLQKAEGGEKCICKKRTLQSQYLEEGRYLQSHTLFLITITVSYDVQLNEWIFTRARGTKRG